MFDFFTFWQSFLLLQVNGTGVLPEEPEKMNYLKSYPVASGFRKNLWIISS